MFKSSRTAILVVVVCTLAGALPGLAQKSVRNPHPGPALTGTWYAQFLIPETPPGFNLPVLLTFHADGTFEAVDAGDFGLIPELPFDQTSQHGKWEWVGENDYLATGLVFSFSRQEGTEGQLDNILKTGIEIELSEDGDSFVALVEQSMWLCPDSFFCPDPLTDAPDVFIPAAEAGFSIWARRLR